MTIVKNEMKIFFSCGTGRSGTTILRKIFSRHSKVFAFPFESRFIVDPDGLVDLYESCLREFVVSFMTPVLDQHKATHWCEDSPFSILHAQSILRILPQAKFVHIYRDPRDVVASYTRQLWAPTDIEMAIKFYKSVIQRILKTHDMLPDGSLLEVAMEDLIKTPDRILSRIADFVGLQTEQPMFSAKLNPGNIGKWKRSCTREEKVYLASSLKEIVVELGYSNHG